ncbi:MAG: hypothetical protein ACHQF3_07655 [Alphaproteobacteria bacterium]
MPVIANSVLGLILGPLILAVILGIFVPPILAIWRWRGPWRVLALLALAPLVIDIARIVVDTRRDPTAHNLLPFELMLWGGSGLLFLAVLWLLRSIIARR